MSPILEISDLSIGFSADDGGVARVVKNVGFAVETGRIVAVVGESGSGKTMLARAVINLLPLGARVMGGQIRFDGENLLASPLERLRRIRK